MNIYTNNSFRGHWPVGTSAVVVSNTPEQAASLLANRLQSIGLMQDVKAEEMIPLPTDALCVLILQDGNY